MEAIKSGDAPKLPRGKLETQTEMSKWWKDFTTYQKCHGEKWITYNAQNEPVVNGHWKMVGGTSGPSIQPNLPNYILVAVPADAVAAVRHSAERQNADMIKENRKLIEKLCSERIIFAELIKECVEPIIPSLMRTATGPGLFDDPTNPLLMLQLIRRFNPHDREMTGNSVRNFYDSEGYFKSNYQGASSAYDFLEAKRTQWEHLVSLCDRANDEAAGSVIMMTERERVIVLMSTIHAGYRTLKRRIDLGELPAVITMIEFTNFINKYEITAEELRPKLIPQRKIFATTKSEATKTVCRLVGHTPGHEYGGLECNNECKIKMNKKESYAESQRNDVKRLTGSNDK